MIDPVGRNITVSVVSHAQGALVADLLEDLSKCGGLAEIIVTQNLPEADIPCPAPIRDRVRVIRNQHPLGFAANHNAAFQFCLTDFFAVLNPDLRLPIDPFPSLLACLASNGDALAAPAVLNASGTIEDSARAYPSLTGLFLKILAISDGRIKYQLNDAPLRPDWIAGMFLLIQSSAFRSIGGFDPDFRLYYEDVDLCVRLKRFGRQVVLCPSVHVIHNARRSSHRKVLYLYWHVASMVRYFRKHMWRLPERKTL